MAQKRMFTMKIVDSDAFLDMPLSTQCLYFHLNMRADDDGFIGNPKKIMRMIGASEDDLKILLAKRFLLIFEDSVVVVKHWWMHNTLAKDRYHETSYTDEKALLKIKENKAYTLGPEGQEIKPIENDVKMLTERKQNVNSDLDLDLDKDIDSEEDLKSVCYSGSVQKINTSKNDFQQFLRDSFSMINAHNEQKKNTIGISASFSSYMQKEGKVYLEILRDIEIADLYIALNNYIKVTECDTWKTYFGFNDFTKNYVDYIPQNFELSKFAIVPKNEDAKIEIAQAFADKNINESWFDYAVFKKHIEEWFKAGKPEGKDFEKWADYQFTQDCENGIKY